MRVYTVHYRPGSRAPDREAVLVKEGFSWPGFLLGPFWALWHGMWLWAVVLLVVELAAEFAGDFANLRPEAAAAIGLGVAALVGCFANDLYRRSLAWRGWVEEGLVAAAGRDAALRRWFDLNPPRTA
jgi:Protein of unknown function (DUF2628)